MNKNLLTPLCMVNYENDKTWNADSFIRYQTNLFLKKHFLFLNAWFLIMLSFGANAQETLVGLTSNGGLQGKGTVFSFKTNATAFTIIKAFPEWGKNPWGDLLKGADGNFYGMTSVGGTFNYGTIFKATPTGVITILHQLNYAT